MTLDIPVRVGIFGVVLLFTSNLDLLETPLRQDSICSSQIAAQCLMLEAQTCRQRVDPVDLLATVDIVYNFDLPVIMPVANGVIAIARNLIGGLGHRGSDVVRVKVASSGFVAETDDVAVLKVSDGCIMVVSRLIPSGKNDPIVVFVLVVVACHLLLI